MLVVVKKFKTYKLIDGNRKKILRKIFFFFRKIFYDLIDM